MFLLRKHPFILPIYPIGLLDIYLKHCSLATNLHRVCLGRNHNQFVWLESLGVLTHLNCSLTFGADVEYERIERSVIKLLSPIQTDDIGCEIWAIKLL